MDNNSQTNNDVIQPVNELGSDQAQNSKPKHSSKPFILLILIAVILGAADYGVYAWQHNKVNFLSSSQTQLNSKIVSVKQQINSVTNQNNGIVSRTQNTTSGNASLANGAVTYTIPSGWVEATASNFATRCYNGYYGSTVTCLDTTVIVPASLNTNGSTSSSYGGTGGPTYGGINISVYKHTDNTTSQDWYGTDLLGGITPDSKDVTSTTSINGYSTYYLNQGAESLVYGGQLNNEYYVLTNKSYVVVITSNVNNNIGPNGTTKNNDNSQYSSTVKSLAQSIKLQGN